MATKKHPQDVNIELAVFAKTIEKLNKKGYVLIGFRYQSEDSSEQILLTPSQYITDKIVTGELTVRDFHNEMNRIGELHEINHSHENIDFTDDIHEN